MVGALIGAGISIVGGLIQGSQAKKREKALKAEIDAYRRKDLVNVADAISVDTTAIDINAERDDRFLASGLDALTKSGSRAIQGGLPKLTDALITSEENTTKEIARQQKELQTIRAADNARIREINTQNERDDLEGLGTALAASTANRQAANAAVISGVGNLAGSVIGAASDSGGKDGNGDFWGSLFGSGE